MPTPETPPSPLTVESDTASASVSAANVLVAPDTRRPAVYIELPHLGDDDATLWYYVEKDDGIAHRVSSLLSVPMLAGDRYLPI